MQNKNAKKNAEEFSLPDDFFSAPAAKNIIGALKKEVLSAGPGKLTELINLLGNPIPGKQLYSKVGPFIESSIENKTRLAYLIAGQNTEDLSPVEWIRQGEDGIHTECVIDYLVKHLYMSSNGRYKRAFNILGYDNPLKPDDGSSYADNALKPVREAIMNIYKGYPGIFTSKNKK